MCVCVHILRSSKINLDELTVHRWKLLLYTNPWAMADPFTVDILHLVGRYAQMANETLNDETGVASLEDASASRRNRNPEKPPPSRGAGFFLQTGFDQKARIHEVWANFVQFILIIPRYPKLAKILEHDSTNMFQFCVIILEERPSQIPLK